MNEKTSSPHDLGRRGPLDAGVGEQVGYYATTVQGESGEGFRIAVARAPNMGEAAVALTAGKLVGELRPRCLAMTGICAGRRGDAEIMVDEDRC